MTFLPVLLKKRWRAICVLLALGIAPFLSYGASGAVSSADRLMQFLNQTIAFYHQTAIQQQIATEPQEQVLLYDNRQIANQAVGFAFDFARAQVDAMASGNNTASPSGGLPQSSSLQKALATVEKQIQDTQAETDSDRQKLPKAAPAQRAQLQSEISETQGELALAQARRDAIQNMLDFLNGSATNSLDTSGLKAQIDALAASVPAASSSSASAAIQSASQATPIVATKPAPSGIWDLTANLFDLSAKRRSVKSMINETDALMKTSDDLRAPFVTQMQTLSKNGDQVAAEADSASRTVLSQETQQLDALTTQFKQLSAAVIPLGKQRVLLNLYLKNLASWQDDVIEEYKSDLSNLAIRLVLLGMLLGVLIGLAELWRRAVYRYVHDLRRRHQFLLLRKLALWSVLALIIAGTLAGKFGSFATFAGLLTAGVAVALQNVIVAVVGYFFLIGKFGIRIGDRVEVSGTNGEVIEIGLVRFHLMEFGAGGTPTGRAVAFSNSVVFQSSAGLFRQIPGATFAWHEITLTLPRDLDIAQTEKHLLDAVQGILAEYRHELERVSGELERRGISFSDGRLQPKLELHVTSGGIDATVRYPVDFQHASDIDARVSRELFLVMERDTITTESPEAQKPGVSARSAD